MELVVLELLARRECLRFLRVFSFSSLCEGLEALNGKLAALTSQQRTASSFVQLQDPMATMTDLIADTPVSSAPDMSAINGASDIIKGIASVEAPAKRGLALDPRPIIYESCERDTAGCPLGEPFFLFDWMCTHR